jgi:type II secretory pathway component PulM
MVTKSKATVTPADIEALHELLADAAKRRGREQVYRWAGHAVWAVAAILLTWWLNSRGVQRNEESRHEHRQQTAEVERKLDKVEAVTKTLAPEAFLPSGQFSSKMAK